MTKTGGETKTTRSRTAVGSRDSSRPETEIRRQLRPEVGHRIEVLGRGPGGSRGVMAQGGVVTMGGVRVSGMLDLDEEALHKVKEEDEERNRKWREEQRKKYPIAPDGYVPNSVIRSVLCPKHDDKWNIKQSATFWRPTAVVVLFKEQEQDGDDEVKQWDTGSDEDEDVERHWDSSDDDDDDEDSRRRKRQDAKNSVLATSTTPGNATQKVRFADESKMNGDVVQKNDKKDEEEESWMQRRAQKTPQTSNRTKEITRGLGTRDSKRSGDKEAISPSETSIKKSTGNGKDSAEEGSRFPCPVHMEHLLSPAVENRDDKEADNDDEAKHLSLRDAQDISTRGSDSRNLYDVSDDVESLGDDVANEDNEVASHPRKLSSTNDAQLTNSISAVQNSAQSDQILAGRSQTGSSRSEDGQGWGADGSSGAEYSSWNDGRDQTSSQFTGEDTESLLDNDSGYSVSYVPNLSVSRLSSGYQPPEFKSSISSRHKDRRKDRQTSRAKNVTPRDVNTSPHDSGRMTSRNSNSSRQLRNDITQTSLYDWTQAARDVIRESSKFCPGVAPAVGDVDLGFYERNGIRYVGLLPKSYTTLAGPETRQSSGHYCRYSVLLKRRMHDHISIGKHLSNLELVEALTDLRRPLSSKTIKPSPRFNLVMV